MRKGDTQLTEMTFEDNVYIRDSTPTIKLQLAPGTPTTAATFTSNDEAGNARFIISSGTDASAAATIQLFDQGGETRFLIDSDGGLVGRDDGGNARINWATGTAATDATLTLLDSLVSKIEISSSDSYRISFTDGGTDVDINMYRVAVTGTPLAFWDESEDAFSQNKGLRITAGTLGIGIETPTEELDVKGQARVFDDGNAAFFLSQATTDTVSATYQFRKSRGTHASPTAVVSGDLLGQETWRGHDGTDFQSSALLRVLVDGAVSAGVVPSRIVYQTTDTSGTRADRITIKGSGQVGIGTGSPGAQLHVDQASTTAAIPVLYLDQADVDQPLIEFATTIGTGNAIEAVGAKTLTTTHFGMIKIPGGLTRYFPIGTIA